MSTFMKLDIFCRRIRYAIIVIASFLLLPSAICQETAKSEGIDHLMGKWICNNDPADIYLINPDKTAQHFVDKGAWKVAENTLTIAWTNGFRLTFDTTQKGAKLIGNSYPPDKTEADTLTFTREKQEPLPPLPSKASVTLPAERALTSADGRQVVGTVLSKSPKGIKFRRDSVSKEFDISLDKLSAVDRNWVENAKNKPVAKALLYKIAKDANLIRLIDYMESKGIEVTLMDQSKSDGSRRLFLGNPERPWMHYDEINPADYDIVLLGGYPFYEQYDRLGLIIAIDRFTVTNKKDLLAGKYEFDENSVKRPKITVSENFIFYHCYTITREKKNAQVFEHHYKVVDTALDMAMRRKKQETSWRIPIQRSTVQTTIKKARPEFRSGFFIFCIPANPTLKNRVLSQDTTPPRVMN